jgi:hypothetical protein
MNKYTDNYLLEKGYFESPFQYPNLTSTLTIQLKPDVKLIVREPVTWIDSLSYLGGLLVIFNFTIIIGFLNKVGLNSHLSTLYGDDYKKLLSFDSLISQTENNYYQSNNKGNSTSDKSLFGRNKKGGAGGSLGMNDSLGSEVDR